MYRVFQANLDHIDHATGIVACLDAYARDPMGGGEPLSEQVQDDVIAGLKSHPACAAFLVACDTQVVGVAVCFMGYSTFRARPRLNLHDLAVLPGHRRQGLGRQLLEAVVAFAHSQHCCAVSLEVRNDNPGAQALYRSLGFDAGSSPMEFWVKPLPTSS